MWSIINSFFLIICVSSNNITNKLIMSTNKSKVWAFFEICEDNKCLAKCKLCKNKFSRGGEGKCASTSPLIRHLKISHPSDYNTHFMNKDECNKPGTSKSITLEPVTRQPTLQEFTSSKKMWDINDKRARQIHYKLAEMICLDNQPYSIVENTGFCRLFKCISPQYKMPSRNFFRDNIIPDIYKKICEKIKTNLQTKEKDLWLSLTSDIWTCTNTNVSFISLTGHWIGDDWKKENVILNCDSFPGSHKGVAIADKILRLVNTWGIKIENIHLMLRDSGANMIKGCKDANIGSESCFIHTLQLVVMDSIKSQRAISDLIAVAKRIATHFGHSSLACDKLKKIQEEHGFSVKKVIQDVPTRWNSTFYMLERLQELKRSIIIYCAEQENLGFNSLTSNQWELLNSAVRLLRPFEEVTKTVSSTESVISDVIPIITSLKGFLSVDSTSYMGTTRDALLENIDKRFQLIYQNPNYVIATVLDPRYKLAFFPPENILFAKQCVLNEITKFKEITTNSTENLNLTAVHDSDIDSDEEPLSKKIMKHQEVPSVWTCFEKIATPFSLIGNVSVDHEQKIADQFENYLNKPLQERKSDPIHWWKEHKDEFPNGAQVAKRYLSAPASSVYSERSFSEIGNIYEEKRSRLTSQNAEKLLFIHHNLKKIHFDY